MLTDFDVACIVVSAVRDVLADKLKGGEWQSDPTLGERERARHVLTPTRLMTMITTCVRGIAEGLNLLPDQESMHLDRILKDITIKIAEHTFEGIDVDEMNKWLRDRHC